MITDDDPRMLVEAHNAGDRAAFEHIVLAHGGALLAHAVGRLRDVQAAEDAVQETFVRAYRALPQFEGDFHLRAWLHRILTNVCHDEGSRRQRDGLLFERVCSQGPVGGEPADAGIERLDVDRDVLARAMAELSESHREALVLRYVEELSYEEVAAATGVTEGNARVRVMRGRVALKRAITSSHVVVLGLLPWLRRIGRSPGAVPSLHGAGAGAASAGASTATGPGLVTAAPNLLTSASLLLPGTDAAPLAVERMATLPQVLGLVATLAVPVAAPAVGDEVVAWAARPPAAVAPSAPDGDDGPTTSAMTTGSTTPAPQSPAVPRLRGGAGGAGGAASAGGGPAGGVSRPPEAQPTPTPGSTPPVAPAVTPRRPPTPAPLSAPAPTASPVEETATPSTDPVPEPVVDQTTLTTGGPTTTATAPPDRDAAPPVAVGRLVEPEVAGAPPVAFAASLLADQLTGAWSGTDRLELEGVVAWARGPGTASPLDLRGTIERAPVGPVGAGAIEVVGPTAVAFTATLSLSPEDGRPYRLVLTEGTLAGAGAEVALSASFELRDACDVLVATGAVTGDLHAQEAPGPSSLALTLEGEGPAAVPACG